jgi:hypothetical protein
MVDESERRRPVDWPPSGLFVFSTFVRTWWTINRSRGGAPVPEAPAPRGYCCWITAGKPSSRLSIIKQSCFVPLGAVAQLKMVRAFFAKIETGGLFWNADLQMQ